MFSRIHSRPPSLGTLRAWLLILATAGFSTSTRPIKAADASQLSTTATPPAQLKVLKDFKVELLHSVPKADQGSWVAMTVETKGRLVVSDQYGKLYRVTPPALGTTQGLKIEPIAIEVGQAQGLLYAFDSLYVMVANDSYQGRGLYRVRDTNGDDKYDEVKLLRKLQGGGEHGPHAIVLSPDQQSLHIVIGNQTKLTELNASRVPYLWSEDHLITRLWDGNGFMKGVLAPGGWIAKTDPEGKSWELISNGFRNEYDAAFNRDGELFTYDADMEWDLNTPWYRPTRVNHVTSGAEFGWRSGAGKWPAYYADSLPAVIDIGPGSPTGVSFGYGAKFPAKYQDAFYICDWSYGKLYAVHLKPDGSSYSATSEEFITGQPFPLTDLVVNPADGAMYITIGGRKTQSGFYRVTYAGNESTAPAKANTAGARDRAIRRSLEAFHGRKDPRAVAEALRHLGHKDRYIRFAARVALEWQDPALWADKVLNERNPVASINGLIGLARASSKDVHHRKASDPAPDAALQARILTALDRIDWARLEEPKKLDLLRAYSLAFTRFHKPDEATRQRLISRFDPVFPTKSRQLNAELAQLLVYLEAPSAATKLVAQLSSAPTQEEQLDYARTIRVLKTGWSPQLRETYFKWFLKAVNFRGGASLNGFLRDIKNDAVANLTPAEKQALQPILDAKGERKSPLELLASRPMVKEWTLDELTAAANRGLKSGRDFDRGRLLFGAAACAACHRFDNEGASVGPDLTGVSGRFSPRDLLESIMVPSKEISDQYGAINIRLKNGESVTGRVANLNDDTLMVIENMFAPGEMTNVKRRDVDTIVPSTVSMMPEGLLSTLKEDEVLDLMAYLLSRGDRNHRMFR